jgi:hypothetical protein
MRLWPPDDYDQSSGAAQVGWVEQAFLELRRAGPSAAFFVGFPGIGVQGQAQAAFGSPGGRPDIGRMAPSPGQGRIFKLNFFPK